MTSETQAPKHLATITGIETPARTSLTADGGDLADLAPAAAAALRLLADAITRGHVNQDDIVQALQDAKGLRRRPGGRLQRRDGRDRGPLRHRLQPHRRQPQRRGQPGPRHLPLDLTNPPRTRPDRLNRYLLYMARRHGVPVCTTLTDTVAAALTLVTSSR